jgi:hypothetical protein
MPMPTSTAWTPNERAICGSDVAITEPSSCSMKKAVATMSDVMRARDATVSGVIVFRRTDPVPNPLAGLGHGER